MQCTADKGRSRGDEGTCECRIGALATAADVTVDTLRFYEREGLLPPANRTSGGFRLYGPDVAQRVRFIRQARLAGFTLGEIRQLIAPDDMRCLAVRGRIRERLAAVERQLAELEALRQTLQAALGRCTRTLRHSKAATCDVAPTLGTGALSRARRPSRKGSA